MRFIELYNFLDIMIPTSLSCEWDNDGIMCASDNDKEVRKILFALDVTSDVLEYARANSYDTVISHHPFVFNKLDGIKDDFVSKKIVFAIKNGINIMSFHTRLDAVENGVADSFAKLFDYDFKKVDKNGIGRVLELNKTYKLEAFCNYVKEKTKTQAVFYIGNNDVKKIYVCPGDGKDFIDDAIICGCDTLVTGRASYNSMIDAEQKGLNVVECGHYYSENVVFKSLEKMIKKLDNTIEMKTICSTKIKMV